MNIDKKLFNLVVLIDLKKAFDTVEHQILLKKPRNLWRKRRCFGSTKIVLDKSHSEMPS